MSLGAWGNFDGHEAFENDVFGTPPSRSVSLCAWTRIEVLFLGEKSCPMGLQGCLEVVACCHFVRMGFRGSLEPGRIQREDGFVRMVLLSRDPVHCFGSLMC